jgi:hypothetical protein
MRLANPVCRVVIKVVSSLTPDDENVCAPAILQLCVNLLAMLPIAYAVRIETVDKVFQHSAPDTGRSAVQGSLFPSAETLAHEIAH